MQERDHELDTCSFSESLNQFSEHDLVFLKDLKNEAGTLENLARHLQKSVCFQTFFALSCQRWQHLSRINKQCSEYMMEIVDLLGHPYIFVDFPSLWVKSIEDNGDLKNIRIMTKNSATISLYRLLVFSEDSSLLYLYTH